MFRSEKDIQFLFTKEFTICSLCKALILLIQTSLSLCNAGVFLLFHMHMNTL